MRLTFVNESGEDVWLSLFLQVSEGSLDAATRREIEHLGSDRAARNVLATYRMLPGSRDWWRAAYDGEELVGFGIPWRNDGGHIVAYLGVLPDHRGHSYVDDIVAGAHGGRIRARSSSQFRNSLGGQPLIHSRSPFVDGAS